MTRRIHLHVVALGLFACGALAVQPAAAQLRSPLITEIEASQRGLTRAWFAQVPIDRTQDRVEHVTLHNGTLFVQTRRGTVTALDGETGNRLWSTNIGSREHPTTAVGANKTYVAALNGSDLYVLRRDTGKLVWKRRMKGAPGAGPALTEEHVIVPMINGMVEGYQLALEDHRTPPWIYNSSGRAVIQPFVTPISVGWPTDRGLFYVAGAELLNVRFRVEAVEPIVCKPAYLAPHFFVGSLDGYLYKVHERTGSMVWRYSTGQPITQQPLAAYDRIYVAADRSGLYCVANDAAREVWWSPGIDRVLSVSPERVYAVDDAGRLCVMQGDSGAVLSRFPAAGLDLFITNTENDRIYVGNHLGVIQCLHEPALAEPAVHRVERPTAEETEIRQIGVDELPDEPEEPEAEQPAADNPFGGMGDDPFGGGANDPFGGGGAAPPANDNPFDGDAAPPAGDPFGGGAADDGAGENPFGGGADPFGGGADPFGG